MPFSSLDWCSTHLREFGSSVERDDGCHAVLGDVRITTSTAQDSGLQDA
jgi:hypothetical protein